MPALRFPEFQDAEAWQITKLRRLAKRNTHRNVDGSETRVLTNSAEFGVVDQRDFFDKDIANQSNLEGYYVVEEGDYVYNPRISTFAPVGPISKNKLGTGVMSPLYTVFRFNSDNNNFYEQFFKTAQWHKYMRVVSNSGARHDRMTISADDFIDMPLPEPHPKEQQKIADCLTSIDDLITAQTQKLEALKTHKKGLMQQLFPRDGETVPKLRFPEFQDAAGWEEKSLGRMARKFLDGDWIEAKDQSSQGVRLIQTGNIGVGEFIPKAGNARFISEETFEKLKCTEILPGDCLISRLPNPAGRSCIIPDIGQRMITAVDCTIVRFDERQVVPYLFIAYSQTHQYFADVEAQSSGSTRKRISKENLSQTRVPVPLNRP